MLDVRQERYLMKGIVDVLEMCECVCVCVWEREREGERFDARLSVGLRGKWYLIARACVFIFHCKGHTSSSSSSSSKLLKKFIFSTFLFVSIEFLLDMIISNIGPLTLGQCFDKTIKKLFTGFVNFLWNLTYSPGFLNASVSSYHFSNVCFKMWLMWWL